MKQVNRSNLLFWLISTLFISVVIPLIIFICVSQCFRGSWIDGSSQVAFKIGSFSVVWYSLFIFLGFMCAICLACIKMNKIYKISTEPFYWYCLMGVPSSILGARIWSCVLGDASWDGFWDFRNGGLAIEGGVILTVIVGLIYFPIILKKPSFQVRDEFNQPVFVRRVSVWVYADVIVPAILIGQIIGRYGNYMNQEVYGTNISGSWANFVNNLFPFMNVDGEGIKQPLFLIESFFNFWGLILIYFVGEFIPKKKAGDLAISYFLWYGLLRTILNPLRDNQYAFNSVSITFSVIWVVCGLVLLIMNHTLFPKLREYYCWKLIFGYALYCFNRNKQKWETTKTHKKRKNEEIKFYFGR